MAHESPAPADETPDAAGRRPGDGFVQSFARGLAVLRSFGADAGGRKPG